ncbi:MAG: MOSC domain-containing protein, partial [Planctomycetota bacterium]
MAKIVGVCLSDRKGISKKNVGEAYLEAGRGVKDDANAGPWHRQVSLLAK